MMMKDRACSGVTGNWRVKHLQYKYGRIVLSLLLAFAAVNNDILAVAGGIPGMLQVLSIRRGHD